MALVDTEVIRDGKWVSESKTDTIPGEACINIRDGYGYYEYRLSSIPIYEDEQCTILDTDTSNEKERKFNKVLEKYGLPIYFNVEKEEKDT